MVREAASQAAAHAAHDVGGCIAGSIQHKYDVVDIVMRSEEELAGRQ